MPQEVQQARSPMMRARWLSLAIAALVPLHWVGCGQVAEENAEHSHQTANPHGSASPSASATTHGGPAAAEDPSGHADSQPRRFPVPFAWEASSADPLAKARGFLREAIDANGSYVKGHQPPFFKPFADAQHPRATVVTCSDSRVQSPALDSTPEDDLFFIRNIGNQVINSQGSVEYGVHHLKTPVLLILGHTGCGAVKAAMGDFSKESPAIQKELASLTLPKPAGKPEDAKAWLDAVIANVNNQVNKAVNLFAHELGGGDLTVVGAVYDFRNDMKLGHGRMTIVNVNGQTDAQRVGSFVRAIGSAALLPAGLPTASARPPVR